MQDREATIRARAYQLWEESGHAHGKHEQHWRQAEREYDEVRLTAIAQLVGDDVGIPSAETVHGETAKPEEPVTEQPVSPAKKPRPARKPSSGGTLS